MVLHFREHSPRQTSSKIITNQGKRLTIRYNPKQIGKDFPSVHEFSQRQDVEQAFPYLSRRRKVHLTRIGIEARNGETHDYLVLRQGRKRFLFDTEDNQISLTDISNERRRKRLSLTLVVPYSVMQEKGLLPQDTKSIGRFGSRRDEGKFFRQVEKEGYFAVRGNPTDPKSIENNTDFIQPIPALVMKDTQGNILFTVRGGDGANHDERLSGKIATPYTMGHSQPSDFGLWRRFLRYGLKVALYRETGEEAALRKGKKTSPIFSSFDGHEYNVTLRGILNLHRYYRIQPFGVVYKEDTPVDKLHAGIIFVATPKRRDVELTLNGKSREVHEVIPLSPQGYQKAIIEKGLTPTSWDEPIIQELIKQQ